MAVGKKNSEANLIGDAEHKIKGIEARRFTYLFNVYLFIWAIHEWTN